MELPNQTPNGAVLPAKPAPISRVEILALLNKLAVLPYEVALPILYHLDYHSLNAVCEAIKTASNDPRIKLSWMGGFCSDVNFWRDYLFERGYDLPEGLPVLVRVLKLKGETNLEVLTDLFFGNDGISVRGQQLKNLLNNLKTFQINKKLSDAQIGQLILDFDYLRAQINNRRPYPKVFSIVTTRTENDQETTLSFPLKMSSDDFLQLLADYDLYRTNTTDNLSTWGLGVYSILSRQEFKDAPRIRQRLEEQSLAILPSLAREGDIVAFQVHDPEGYVIQDAFYYVGPGNIFHLINSHETEEGVYPFVFPGIARSFLDKNQVIDRNKLLKLYPELGDTTRFGFLGPFDQIKDGHQVEFPAD